MVWKDDMLDEPAKKVVSANAGRYDFDFDILYIVMGGGDYDHSIEVCSGILADIDRNNCVYSFEIFDASKKLGMTKEDLKKAYGVVAE